jgi:hypothetical protein
MTMFCAPWQCSKQASSAFARHSHLSNVLGNSHGFGLPNTHSTTCCNEEVRVLWGGTPKIYRYTNKYTIHSTYYITLTKHSCGEGRCSIRPVAVGEVWYQLACLCGLAGCPGAWLRLKPLQLGVGVAGGAQIVGHAFRAGMTAEPSSITLQLDWGNGFNSLLAEDAGCGGPAVPSTPTARLLGGPGSQSSPCPWQARCHHPIHAWRVAGGPARAAFFGADHAGAAGRPPAAWAPSQSRGLCGQYLLARLRCCCDCSIPDLVRRRGAFGPESGPRQMRCTRGG